MQRKILVLMTLSAVLIWALSYPLIKIGLESVPPISLGMLRHLIFLPLLLFLLLTKGKKGVAHPRARWFIFIGIGFFAIALPNVLQNIGMMYTGATVASIIQSSGPIFTLLLAIIALGESLRKEKIVGAILALIGAVWLITGGELVFTGTTFGNLLLLGSAFSYSISGIITKKGLGTVEPLHLLTFGTGIGFFLLLILSLLFEPLSFHFPFIAWLSIALLALFPTAVATLLWYKVLSETELSKLVVFVYLMPLFTFILSHLLLGEIIGITEAVCAGLIIGGVALAQKK